MADELNIGLLTVGLTTLVARIYTPGFVQVGGDVAMAEVAGPVEGTYKGTASGLSLPRGTLGVLFFDTLGTPDTLMGTGELGWNDEGDKEFEPMTSQMDDWQEQGLDPDIPATYQEITPDADYNVDAGAALHKDVVTVGDTTTFTRT